MRSSNDFGKMLAFYEKYSGIFNHISQEILDKCDAD